MYFDPWLRQLLRDIFESADDVWGMSTAELAREADLCWQTVHKIRNKITKEPRLRTVFKLCKAVGMDLKLVRQSLRKRVA
jgi:DNA-binding phage protein